MRDGALTAGACLKPPASRTPSCAALSLHRAAAASANLCPSLSHIHTHTCPSVSLLNASSVSHTHKQLHPPLLPPPCCPLFSTGPFAVYAPASPSPYQASFSFSFSLSLIHTYIHMHCLSPRPLHVCACLPLASMLAQGSTPLRMLSPVNRQTSLREAYNRL